MAKMPNRKMKFKLNVVVLGFLSIGFLILIIRIIYIAFFANVDGVKYGVKAKNSQMSATTIRANRGTIYDRNMVPLAQSATVWIITISPNQFKSEEQKLNVAKDLCDMLKIQDRDKIFNRFKSKRKYEIIKKNVEKPERDEILKYIKRNKLTNIVNIEEDTKRYYPLASIASHTIGFVGADNQGLLGLELFYDKILKGKDGKLLRLQDAKGGPMPYEFENLYPAKNGNSIVVSIDSVIQRICSEALSDLFKWHRPENRCLAIVMNAKTGEIVALAVNPEFDLNNPFVVPSSSILPATKSMTEKDARAFNWKNKAVSENYEPGSVFKVVTASAALEEKTMTLNSRFNCTGAVMVQGEKMRCWESKGHGSENFVQACVNSCNPAFVAIGHSLGAKKFSKYLDLYGITKRTKVDLPGETDPIYHKEKNLTPVSLASESFGQSLSITPLQMVTAFSAVVNDGFLYQPHFLKHVLDENGNVIKTNNKKPIRQVISKETSKTMREILGAVVKGPNETGTNASVPGYLVGGKTGTAQKLEEERKTGRKTYVSSFTGFLSVNNPQYVVMVLADTPSSGQHYGNVVASPIFSRIALKSAPYLGINSTYTKEEYDKFFNQVPICEGIKWPEAEKKLKKYGFNNIKFLGKEDENIISQFPEPGINVNKNAKIYLYGNEKQLKENTTKTPNILGMSPARAKETLENCGLNIVSENIFNKSQNKSTVISQFPEQDTTLVKGSVVEVSFQVTDHTG